LNLELGEAPRSQRSKRKVKKLETSRFPSYADTEFEAVNRLCEEIVALYEDLRKNRENLGILPQKWLAFLDEVIEVHENS
jgi:hypothetical protein